MAIATTQTNPANVPKGQLRRKRMPSHTPKEQAKRSGSKSVSRMASQIKPANAKSSHKDMKPKDKSGFARSK